MLLLACFAATMPALAQDRVWRLGVLTPGQERPGSSTIFEITLPALAEHGFVEGRNLTVLVGAARGDLARLQNLAESLAAERVDVVIAVGSQAINAALAAAPSTPIVMSFIGEDPVAAGIAHSLGHPGGRVTGIFFRAGETDAKRLELLSEALPRSRKFGFLAAPTLLPERTELLARAAARLNVALATQTVRHASEYGDAFAALKAAGADAVLVQATTIFGREASIFAPIATRQRLATICEWDYMAREGCTFGFGPDLAALRKRTADYIARIFKGADPGELPIEQPDRFTLVVNLQSAVQLGLELSPSLLARADEVIE